MKQRHPNSSVTSAPPPHEDPIEPPDRPQVVSAEKTEQNPNPPAERAHDEIDSDLRHRMISEAAYRLYEKRGYAEGNAMDDWLEAEAAIDLSRHQKMSTIPEAGYGRPSQPRE
jgi:DUF2934 family protein